MAPSSCTIRYCSARPPMWNKSRSPSRKFMRTPRHCAKLQAAPNGVAEGALVRHNNTVSLAISLGEPAMAFVKVATVSEVPVGKSKQVKVGGKTLALFNVAGTIYAIDDTCPHRGAPLWEGELEGHEVICPWHAAAFDVTSYKVQIVGDEVQVDLL